MHQELIKPEKITSILLLLEFMPNSFRILKNFILKISRKYINYKFKS